MVQGLSARPPELALPQADRAGRKFRAETDPWLRMMDRPGEGWPQPLTLWVDTAEQAREAVEHAKAEGYDRLRCNFLEKEPYDAVISPHTRTEWTGSESRRKRRRVVLEAGQRMIATPRSRQHAHGDYRPERIGLLATSWAKRGGSG